MFQRLILTLMTAASLSGLYVIYSVAMRPVVVVPARSEKKNESHEINVNRPVENTRVARKYIPPTRWPTVTDSKYMFRTDEAFIYTESWKPDPENNKRVLFKPLAVVWLSKDKEGKEQALSVVSESAMLEFASPFDEKSQQPGRIVGALLKDAVEITGPDGLRVVGTDFRFEEAAHSLYSRNPVNFWYLTHKGSATRMEMKLIPGEGPPGNDRPHIYGIESIHLSGRPNPENPSIQYVKLRMDMPQGDSTRPMYAQCSGDLTYTVATHTAVLTTDVRVGTVQKPSDTLECDRLTIQFTPKKVEPSSEAVDSQTGSVDGQKRTNNYQKLETNLEFSQLTAVEGKNSPVKIRSPSNGVFATMGQFEYREDTRIVVMTANDSKGEVEVTRNGSTLKAPIIKAQLDQLKQNVSSLICLGAGNLKYFDEESGRLSYVATWQKHLRKDKDETTNLDLVEFEGEAQFLQPKQDPKERSGLTAERIRIWLAPVDFALPSQGVEGNKAAKPADPEPKRIIAERDVRLQSPQMWIKRTNILEIKFDDEADSADIPVTQLPRSKLRPAEFTSSSPEIRRRKSSNASNQINPILPSGSVSQKRQVGFASIPSSPLGSLGPPVDIPFDEPHEPEPKKISGPLAKRTIERTYVSADRIFIRMRKVTGTQEMQPRLVQSEGKVKITQDPKPGEKPLTLVGDRVNLQIETQEKLIAHVQGIPALIRDRGFRIEGKDIHLDRGANRFWVDGSGVLSVPLPAKSPVPGMDPTPNREMVVRWDEKMNFNGIEAEFLGNIEAKSGYAKMNCGQMLVRLVQPVSFQDEKFEAEPELKTIRCRERVKFENSTYKDKNVIEVYRGKVGDFELDWASGNVKAQGPGEIFSWQRHDKNGGTASQETVQANRPIPTEVTVWDYSRVRFEGRLKGKFDGQTTGNSTRQSVEIHDRVEVIYGPVKWTTEHIDPDNLPSMAGTMRCGKLEFVNHPVSEKRPVAYRTFRGEINAEVEGQVDGRRFTASADEIKYDESNGLYTLRGRGQNARTTGIGTGHLIARTIQFNPDPKLQILRVDQAVEGQGSQ